MIQVYDKYGKIKSSGTPGAGTVTSISSGNLFPLFTTAVTSPTSTPNIAFTAVSQVQKLFYASPNSGSGVPSFRTIQASDLPSLSGTYVPISRTLTINGVTYDLSADRTWTISSATNLGYTPSPTNGIVTSDTGTDATIPLADATNAGLLKPDKFTVLENTSGTNTGDNATNTTSNAYADAKVADTITDGVTTIAPSQNAVFDALALRKKKIVNDTVSASVTGVIVETLVKTYEVTAGTLTPSGFLEIYAYTQRSAVSSAHSITLKINSVNNFATATTLGTVSTNGNFEPFLGIKGLYVLKNNLVISPVFSSSVGLNIRSSSTAISATCNNTVNSVWFFVSVTPTNVGQTITLEGVEILN